jgi:hypothetical protein
VRRWCSCYCCFSPSCRNEKARKCRFGW